jgi:hypothetical protein
MGIAVEHLLRAGSLEGMLDTSNNLMPAAYRAIDKHIRRGEL